jgi:hypothetical protein
MTDLQLFLPFHCWNIQAQSSAFLTTRCSSTLPTTRGWQNYWNFTMSAEWADNCKESKTPFVSDKLWFDLQSMCIGFKSLVSIKLQNFPNSVVKPAIVNQDCVENHFCQVRASYGQNNNPTFLQQQSVQNSVRFGQTVWSGADISILTGRV